DLYRRRGDLWRDAGDAACRLGRYDEAVEAYRHADDLPTFDQGAITARRVYAAVRLGNPAEAALVILDQVAQDGGRVDSAVPGLIRYLATTTDIGPRIADALGEVRAALPTPVYPSVDGQLLRARAAALPAEAARRLLREHVAAHDDDAAVSELLESYAGDAPGIAAECV